MTRPRFVRLLRIAASAVSGILCLLLIALWVRSYWWVDNVIGPSRGSLRLGVASSEGWLTVRYRNGELPPQAFPKWTVQIKSAAELEKIYKQMEASIKRTKASFSRPTPGFGWKDNWGFKFPYWLPTVITGILAVIVGWKLPWHFSLRTLLIATTLVAVVLGLLVAMK